MTLRAATDADQALRDRMLEAKRLGLSRREIGPATAQIIVSLIQKKEVSKKSVVTYFGITYKQLKMELNKS